MLGTAPACLLLTRSTPACIPSTGLKKKSVLDTIEKYAKELGLEYGSVSYYMMCDSKFADDIGEIVK